MKPLTNNDLRALRKERQRIGLGLEFAQADLDRLRADWTAIAQPNARDEFENFAITRPNGTTTGVAGPRWLFHLFGLCHRTAQVAFFTPNGMVVLQRRAPTKTSWPDQWDMAVAGHVPQNADGTDMTFEAGALKETEEELGLPAARLPELLQEGRLVPVGAPYFSFDQDEQHNPPLYNAECRQVYAATLTPEGMATMMPDYEELAGIYLCPPEEAWGLLAEGPVASGLRYSLPRVLDWQVQPK